jgi:regulator of chromosome condensation
MSRHIVESSLTPRPVNFKPKKHSSKFSMGFAGGYHTFMVHESGSVYAFGLNNHGQLGVGSTDETDGPEPVEELDGSQIKIVALKGGEHHSLALDSTGIFF